MTDGWILRAPAPGDLGWIVAEHGRHYVGREGFAPSFEALVAGILGQLHGGQDGGQGREADKPAVRTWIAAGTAPIAPGPLGTVTCAPDGPDMRLRLFYVVPQARGLGVGRALLEAVLDHARAHAAVRVILSTHAEHTAACRLYARNGFVCHRSQRQPSHGRNLTVQDWALTL